MLSKKNAIKIQNLNISNELIDLWNKTPQITNSFPDIKITNCTLENKFKYFQENNVKKIQQQIINNSLVEITMENIEFRSTSFFFLNIR